jgi:hypothetical protein
MLMYVAVWFLARISKFASSGMIKQRLVVVLNTLIGYQVSYMMGFLNNLLCTSSIIKKHSVDMSGQMLVTGGWMKVSGMSGAVMV